MAPRPDNTFAPPDLAAVRDAMYRHGVDRIFIKPLAANDNSKQQIYFGPDLSSLPPIPRKPIVAEVGTSQKPGAAGKPIFRAAVDWFWLDSNGHPRLAPGTKLIYYPQYPEVRLSGFLSGCAAGPSALMQASERMEGRFLLFGVGTNNRIIAIVAAPESPLATELSHLELPEFNELFLETSARVPIKGTSRELLLARLNEIHQKGWIAAKKLPHDGGIAQPYLAPNSGGYTLEAEFGVVPNGIAEADYLGWELKQFRLPVCTSARSAIVTLMTSEPDGGHYVEKGVESFVRTYGYRSPSISDRFDFTGRHKLGVVCARTRTTLMLDGADMTTGRMLSADGGFVLVRQGESQIAARWTFAKLLEHWQRKHQLAVYVPSLTRVDPRAHAFCPVVRLAEGTSFARFLRVFAMGLAYFDPGLKIENASTKPKSKRRSQFRVGSAHLAKLYDNLTFVDVTGEGVERYTDQRIQEFDKGEAELEAVLNRRKSSE